MGKSVNTLLLFTALLSLVMIQYVYATEVTYIKEYTYQAGEDDSKLRSRTIALEQIKRLLLEELGTYLTSHTVVKDSELTQDEIVTYTSGSVATIIITEKWDGQNYYMQAKLSADPDKVAQAVNNAKEDKEESAEAEDLRKKYEESMRTIERLKKEAANGKLDNKSKEEYKTAVNELQINQLIEDGNLLLKQKKYDDALETFIQAITLFPKNTRVYLGRALAYKNLKKYDRAVNDFNKSIELDPKNYLAYYNRGRTFNLQKLYDDAITDFNKAIELNPKKAGPYFTRGNALLHKKDYDKALADYNTSTSLAPKYAAAYNGKGRVFSALNKHDLALIEFSKAVEFQPKDSALHYNKGLANYRLKNYDAALADYTKAIEVNPDYHMAYNNRGVIYYKKKQFEAALADYKKALKLDPGNKNALKNKEKALKAISKHEIDSEPDTD